MSNSALDKLNSRTTSATNNSNWWTPHKENQDFSDDSLIGIVVGFFETRYDENSDYKPVMKVRSIGEPSDFEEGTELCTPTHAQVVRAIENNSVELGDLVNITYDGHKLADGSNFASHHYNFGSLPQSDWEETDEAELFSKVIDSYGGLDSDDRGQNGEEDEAGDSGNSNSALDAVGASTDEAASESSSDGSNSALEATSTEKTTEEASEFDKACDFAQELIGMQGGSVKRSLFDNMITDVRDFGVETGEIIDTLGFETEEKDGDEVVAQY